MKKKSNKLRKLENNRYSLLIDNLEKCYMCPNPKSDLHELIGGSNRLNSIRYGLVIPLCRTCHRIATDDPKVVLQNKKLGQETFEKYYDDDFVSIFHRNYK